MDAEHQWRTDGVDPAQAAVPTPHGRPAPDGQQRKGHDKRRPAPAGVLQAQIVGDAGRGVDNGAQASRPGQPAGRSEAGSERRDGDHEHLPGLDQPLHQGL